MFLPAGLAPGTQATFGGSLSTTITLNEHESALPEPSVAVQVTEFVPLGKVEPEDGTQLIPIGSGQLSVAVGVNTTTAEHRPGSVFWVISDGQVIFGGSLSTTVTLNEQELVLPVLSVAVQV